MPIYRELRIKWSVFHRLLRLIDERLRYGTVGLQITLRRRRELLLDYSGLLRARGFTAGRYSPETILPFTLDERALMQRWKQYVQVKICARLLTKSLTQRRLARVVRVVFDGWRTGIGPKQRRRAAQKLAAAERAVSVGILKTTSAGRDGNPKRDSECLGESEVRRVSESLISAAALAQQPVRQLSQAFAERRAQADLQIARRTVVAGWRGSLARDIGLRHIRQEWRVKRAARQEPT